VLALPSITEIQDLLLCQIIRKDPAGYIVNVEPGEHEALLATSRDLSLNSIVRAQVVSLTSDRAQMLLKEPTIVGEESSQQLSWSILVNAAFQNLPILLGEKQMESPISDLRNLPPRVVRRFWDGILQCNDVNGSSAFLFSAGHVIAFIDEKKKEILGLPSEKFFQNLSKWIHKFEITDKCNTSYYSIPKWVLDPLTALMTGARLEQSSTVTATEYFTDIVGRAENLGLTAALNLEFSDKENYLMFLSSGKFHGTFYFQKCTYVDSFEFAKYLCGQQQNKFLTTCVLNRGELPIGGHRGIHF